MHEFRCLCAVLQEHQARAEQLPQSMESEQAEQHTAHTAQAHLDECRGAIDQEQGNTSCHTMPTESC